MDYFEQEDLTYTRALIDGDIIAYRIGFAAQKTDKETGFILMLYALTSLVSSKLQW